MLDLICCPDVWLIMEYIIKIGTIAHEEHNIMFHSKYSFVLIFVPNRNFYSKYFTRLILILKNEVMILMQN